MPTEIRMPRLVDAMVQGAVVAWRKGEGDRVRAGEVIAEIEADKTTVDLESPAEGILSRILVPAGAGHVAVGEVLAVLEPQSEGVERRSPVSTSPSHGSAEPPQGIPQPETAQGTAADRPEPLQRGSSSRGVAESPPGEAPSRIEATPLASRIARQEGIDLARIRGSGPGGRITRNDVLAALQLESERPLPSQFASTMRAEPSSPADLAQFDEIPLSQVRRIIAERLGEAKRTIPHFYLEAHCRLDDLLACRAELQSYLGAEPRLSLNDFFLRAAALAARKVPEVNASWTDRGIRRYRRVDLAVAVATPAGLLAPVLRNADRKGLAELAVEFRELAVRARDGRLDPADLQGGTFTISNLGNYGIDAFHAIINPPQAAILGIGRAEPRPIAQDGSVVVATMLTCTLSADHRVLDGADAARFLTAFRDLLEHPLSLLL